MCILYNIATKEFANISTSNNKVTLVDSFSLATEISDALAGQVLSKCTKKLKGFQKVNREKFLAQLNETKNICIDISTKTERKAFSQEERLQVYVRDRGVCGICGEFISPDAFTLDHIVPLAKGGSNDLDNIQCCCRKCNLAKADSMPDEYFESLLNILDFQLSKGNSVVKKGFRRIERKYKKKTS